MSYPCGHCLRSVLSLSGSKSPMEVVAHLASSGQSMHFTPSHIFHLPAAVCRGEKGYILKLSISYIRSVSLPYIYTCCLGLWTYVVYMCMLEKKLSCVDDFNGDFKGLEEGSEVWTKTILTYSDIAMLCLTSVRRRALIFSKRLIFIQQCSDLFSQLLFPGADLLFIIISFAFHTIT